MEIPVQVVFDGIAHSDALDALIRALAAKACRPNVRATKCHVTVGLPHRHQSLSGEFRIRVCLHVMRSELVVERTGKDVQAITRDAFLLLAGQVNEYLQRIRGQVRQHGAAHREARPRPHEG